MGSRLNLWTFGNQIFVNCGSFRRFSQCMCQSKLDSKQRPRKSTRDDRSDACYWAEASNNLSTPKIDESPPVTDESVGVPVTHHDRKHSDFFRSCICHDGKELFPLRSTTAVHLGLKLDAMQRTFQMRRLEPPSSPLLCGGATKLLAYSPQTVRHQSVTMVRCEILAFSLQLTTSHVNF